jgi:hypothetical protein
MCYDDQVGGSRSMAACRRCSRTIGGVHGITGGWGAKTNLAKISDSFGRTAVIAYRPSKSFACAFAGERSPTFYASICALKVIADVESV